MIEFIFNKLLIIICVLVPLVLSVAYLVYYERKLIGSLQLRVGPEVLGFKGTLQPFADALKLMFKEVIFPAKARKFLFILAPIIAFVTALIGWAVIPFSVMTLEDGTIIPQVIADINIGFIYLLAVGALEVYGVIIAGWASNSNYAFLGALRSAAQMISYEVSMGLIIACVLLFAGTMNIAEFVVIKHMQPFWVDIFLFPLSIVFFISILAETNRHPFDLPEAESELVSGYNVEYSSIPFVLFFFGEYANMILTSAILVILFWGGWYPLPLLSFLDFIPGAIWLAAKIFVVLSMFIVVRATIPRYRYDQLMNIGWKLFLPISLIYFIITSFLVFYKVIN